MKSPSQIIQSTHLIKAWMVLTKVENFISLKLQEAFSADNLGQSRSQSDTRVVLVKIKSYEPTASELLAATVLEALSEP